jgi:enoyl-CoA hydratase/carnithine racemase
MAHPTPLPISPGGEVHVETRDGIATVRFCHPKGNSLPGSLLRTLAEQITALGRNVATKVIVLRSDGSGPFCAGASFDELKAIADPATGREFFMGFARLITAMTRCPKLIIARVHGKAVGGGVGIVAASDYAVACTDASLRLSELNVGIGPFVVGPVIERKIGLGPFQAMAIDADWRDAAWAERHGLYARVVDNGRELDIVIDTLARRLVASNPQATAALKQIFWAGTEQWDTQLPERAEMSGTMVLSDFTRNAIAAFNR